MGCVITVDGEGDQINSVTGASCKRGEEYARNEFVLPVRTLTSSVGVIDSDRCLLPVRSEKPVPRDRIFDCMDILKNVKVEAPVKMHQVIVPNIANTGVDIVACAEAERMDV